MEKNYENPGLNEAEIKALQQEEYKNKYEKIKEIKNREYINKYNKNRLIIGGGAKNEKQRRRIKQKKRTKWATVKETKL